MRASGLFAAAAMLLPLVNAAGQLGFSLGVKRNSDGNCKTTADFEADLDILKAHTNMIRIYAVSDCNTMENIMPAVISRGFKIILGVWPTDDAHFTLEKEALQTYIPKFGTDNIHAITVGSEHLYRGDLTGAQLAEMIGEVRTLLKGLGADSIPLGTADSWNKFQDGTADPVVAVSNIMLANAFSYWQGQKMDNSSHSFFDDVMQAMGRIQSKNTTDIEFWVGETNWPTGGANYGDAVPSVANAAQYWKESICAMTAWDVNVFVFEAFDETWKPVAKDNDVENHWGVWDENNNPKYDLSC
ncbi:glycoside hydrolase 3 protein [Rhizina undulata]